MYRDVFRFDREGSRLDHEVGGEVDLHLWCDDEHILHLEYFGLGYIDSYPWSLFPKVLWSLIPSGAGNQHVEFGRQKLTRKLAMARRTTHKDSHAGGIVVPIFQCANLGLPECLWVVLDVEVHIRLIHQSVVPMKSIDPNTPPPIRNHR